jgi:hypothetical protein
MEGYICPNKGCKEELHFEMIKSAKMRVYNIKNKKKIYNAYCPKCDEYMQVNEYNKKMEN